MLGVTEFACMGGDDTAQIYFMRQVLALLDANPSVERCAHLHVKQAPPMLCDRLQELLETPHDSALLTMKGPTRRKAAQQRSRSQGRLE